MSPLAAIWKRLDTAGQDAARLAPLENGGCLLEGCAVFVHEEGPACLSYRVALALDWSTMRGQVTGFLGSAPFERRIERSARGWSVNDLLQPELAHLSDLDFGFTPATNLQQLRRIALEPGEAADLPVAWLDVGANRLVELPQSYRRLDDRTYDYRAPSVPYEATLTIAPNGFAEIYPGLWEMERSPA